MKRLVFYSLVSLLLVLPMRCLALTGSQVELVSESGTCTVNSDGICSATSKLYISTGSSASTFAGFNGTINYDSNMTVTIKGENGFTVTLSGTTISAVSSSNAPAGANTLIATITQKYKTSSVSDASITITPNGYSKVTIASPTITKSTTTNSGTTTSPKTGTTLPYVILGFSCLIAFSVYLSTKR